VLDQPYDLVPLGRVWEFPHDQAAVFMAEIERLFRNAQVPIFGRRPGNVDRELIAFPVDYEIDWLGQRSLRGTDYCEPRASRPVDLSAPCRLCCGRATRKCDITWPGCLADTGASALFSRDGG
jgi:hypothetical protein